MNIENIKPGEKPDCVIALNKDDPCYRPSEGVIDNKCLLCEATVALDRASQALMPLPVYCLTCFMQFRNANVVIRRAAPVHVFDAE